MIYIKVNENGRLNTIDNTVSDSVRYEKIKFNFPKSWNGYTKTAVFRNAENIFSVILNGSSNLCTSEDECYIPHEVIKSPEFTVSVFGVSGDARATSSQTVIRVIPSGYGEGDEPSNPTPSEYEQLLNLASETKEIAHSVRTDADNGAFDGNDGYTPQKGIDYVTIDEDTEFIFDGGNADQSIPTDIVVDDTLSDYSTNAVMNKAVTQKLTNLDNRIERNSARNLSDRYILFIGDSYADNWTANSNVGWIEALYRQIASTLGIDLETDEGKNFGNTHYARVSYSGLGFSAITSKSEKKGNAYDELGYFIENNTDFMNKVTDVVFALGYNDAAKAVSSASSTYDDIKDKINLCNTLINDNSSHYVNKYLFAVGWGSNPDVRWQANHIYKNVYSYSAELGWIYSDLRYIMYDSDLYYEDWIHPNMNGSEKIADRILNTLLGNSSIVTCKGRYYTTTTSKENTVNVGYLNVVNNELAQFFLSSAVIYDGDLVTVPQYGTQEICEITGLAPFGQNGSALISDCSFHILDAINNTGSNVVLGCYISKKYCETVGEHDKYKSYLNIKNITDSEIKFNKLAPNNGVINIVPYL